MAYETKVQQYYVGFYGRPATQEELDEWNTKFEEAAPDFSAIRAEFAAESPYAELADEAVDTGDYEDLINFIYQNLFNRDADEGGMEWYVNKLEDEDSGYTVENLVARIAVGAQNSDIDAMANRIEAAEYVTANLGGRDLFEEVDGVGVYDVMALVTADPDSVGAAIDAFDGWLDATDPVVPPPQEGQTFWLEVGSDIGWNPGDDFYGTENNDTYNAWLGTNADGYDANTLNSGDRLDGNGGQNSLHAEVLAGQAIGGTLADIRPVTQNIQDNYFTALLSTEMVQNIGLNLEDIQAILQDYAREEQQWGNFEDMMASDFWSNTIGMSEYGPLFFPVVINAARMRDLDSMWSQDSDGDLVIKNLTTLTSDGAARNTHEVAIGMSHTGNNNTNWYESDYRVYFDDNYLLAGEEITSSQANYWLLDQDGEEQVPESPLLNIDRDGVRFTLDGEEYVVRPADDAALEADTWEEYAQYMRDELARMIEEEGMTRLETIEVRVDDNLIRQTYNDAGQLIDVSAIVFEDTAGGEFTDLGYTIPEDLSGEFNVFGRFSTETADIFDLDVTSTIVLEKVGRGGDGGMLEVGGMDKYFGDGIQVFDVTVKGDGDMPSSLSSLRSTNNALEKVLIATAEEDLEDPASLKIGNSNTHEKTFVFGDNDFVYTNYLETNANALKDVQTLDATDFVGELSVWASLTEDVIPKYLDLQDTQGDPAADNVTFDYAMGNDSSLNLAMAREVVAHEDFELDISAGGGVNDITVGIYGGGYDYPDAALAVNYWPWGPGLNRWYDNQKDLGNLEINTGSGQDTITILGGGDYYINTGSDNDTVYLHNGERYDVEQAAWVLGSTNAEWVYSRAEGTSRLRGDEDYTGAVLFKTQLEVSFLGFEATADIPTAGDGFTATQYHLNQAIKDAIQGDRVLNDLLEVEDGPSHTLVIKSKIDGLMINGDELGLRVLSNGSDDNTSYLTTDVPATGTSALAELAVALGLESDASREDVRDALDDLFTFTANCGEYDNGLFDTLVQPEATVGNEPAYYNESVINVGSGDNLVVLAIDDDPINGESIYNTNTIEFDTTFTKTSIVNFTGAVGLSEPLEQGADILDFTYYLDSTYSPGGSEASTFQVDTTLMNYGTETFANPGDGEVNTNVVSLLEFTALNTGGTGELPANTEFGADLNISQLTGSLNSTYDTIALDDVATNHIFLIENVSYDCDNPGEYLVVNASTSDSSDALSGVSILGIVDFGETIDFAVENFA